MARGAHARNARRVAGGSVTSPRRLGDISETSRRCVFAVVAMLVACGAHATLPRAVGRAFLDAGIPLNHVAIVVQDTTKLRPLFAYDPDRPRNPASVMKLVTTFAALDLLGPDYRWKTEAYLGGPLVDGELQGDLILKGYGDPKITIEQWQAFIAQLRAKGLARIDGNLALDRSYFAVPPYDPAAFDQEPLKPYNVGPDALLVNFKSLKVTLAPDGAVVSVHADPPLDAVALGAPPALADGDCTEWRLQSAAAVEDRGDRAAIRFSGAYPASCGERDWWIATLDHAHYAASMFETYFRAAGGRFDGALTERRAPAGAAPFAVLESPPLEDIVRDVNKLSNNVMARQIFLTLGAMSSPPGTPQKATAAIRRWLAARKLSMPGLVLENGSGLSRRERNSAGGLNRLLIAADRSGVREAFARSLAVAAVDGTVERRFRDADVAGQALLKTGTLEGVRALAGYVDDANGRRFTVVALVNDRNAARAAPALDFLVQWVYRNGATWDATQQRR